MYACLLGRWHIEFMFTFNLTKKKVCDLETYKKYFMVIDRIIFQITFYWHFGIDLGIF